MTLPDLNDYESEHFEDARARTKLVAGVKMYNIFAVMELLGVSEPTIRTYTTDNLKSRKIGYDTWMSEKAIQDFLHGEIGGGMSVRVVQRQKRILKNKLEAEINERTCAYCKKEVTKDTSFITISSAKSKPEHFHIKCCNIILTEDIKTLPVIIEHLIKIGILRNVGDKFVSLIKRFLTNVRKNVMEEENEV